MLPGDTAAIPDDVARSSAHAVAQPLLDAFGDEYATPCEGTGFYALQSCCNHSCAPSAAAEGDVNGETSVLAERDIAQGEEITISYIDESMSFEDRQAALLDYGFVCRCRACLVDSLAAGLESNLTTAEAH